MHPQRSGNDVKYTSNRLASPRRHQSGANVSGGSTGLRELLRELTHCPIGSIAVVSMPSVHADRIAKPKQDRQLTYAAELRLWLLNCSDSTKDNQEKE